MQQNQTKTSAVTTKELHPSGLTMERWNQPFKMPHERKMIQQWLQRRNGQDLNNSGTPF
jgi:hypothetical protein